MDVVNRIDMNFLFMVFSSGTLLVRFSLPANPIVVRS